MELHYFTAWYREVQRHATMHLFRNEREPGLSLLSQRLLELLMIYEITHIWTAEMKWKENEEMIVAVNVIYAIA